MGSFFPLQAASGYLYFLWREFDKEDIGKSTRAVGNTVTDLNEFVKIVKMVAFEPFESTLQPFSQISAFSLDSRKNTKAVGNTVTDLNEFGKIVKMVAFEPFESTLQPLSQISAFSSGQMTDELHKFLALALPKPQEGNNSKLSAGLAELKLGSHIFQVTKVPCQANEFILEVLHGLQVHINRIMNPSMEPFFTVPSKNNSSPDWSNLSPDSLESVAIRMTCSDIIRFKHVCWSWKIAVLNICLISNPPSQPNRRRGTIHVLFASVALPKLQEGNNSKLSVGLAEPILGSNIFQGTMVPCQTNEFIFEVICGVQLHIKSIINPCIKPFFTFPSKSSNFFTSSPDWSNLPTDILESVILKMTCFDIIRFKHVCRSWKIAVLNSCLVSNPPSQPPFLILSTTDNRGCCFYNLVDQKLHREFNNLWGDLDIYCIGCSKGWLILHVVDEESQSSVFIFNPFRLEARKIVIPSDTTHFRITRANYRTLLTSDPIHSGGKFGVIFQTFSDVRLLMQDSYHPENNQWIEFSSLFFLEVSYARDHIFGIVSTSEVLLRRLAWTTEGLLHLGRNKIIKVTPRNFFKEVLWRPWSDDNIILYLVESDGGVLLVTRMLDTLVENGLRVHTTQCFDVFKYCFARKRWVEVESLGDRVLFLGGNHSVCLSVLDIEGCQGNSIYYTDHISLFSNKTGGDTGIFNLEDGSIKQLMWNESRINQRTIWLV